MTEGREKDVRWTVGRDDNGRTSYEAAQLAVLMDLRDELKRLNNLLHCQNFVEIPRVLRAIRRNTARPKRAKVTARAHLLAKRRAA